MQEYDVIVAGGGTAGVAAAVTAARAGARTLLVERTGVLGGQAPIALVHSICGLYHLADDGPPRFANNGFAEEFATRLIASGGAHGPEKMGRVWVLLTRPTAVAELAATMARETPGLDVRLETEVSAASEQNLTLSGPRLRHASEKSVAGNCFVDATGDGALAAMLGAEFEQECCDRLQRPAYIFAVEGAPAVLDDEARLRLARRIVSAVKVGTLPVAALGATLRSTAPLGDVFVNVDLSAGPTYEPTSADCVDALNAEGRVLADSIVDFLRGQIAGFENCRISQVPARIGIRESRRIAGQYRIETCDMESGASFDDAVALAAWPMELRETNRGPRLRYPFTDRPCDIPLRALRFRDRPHCFSAGRCISASHEAHASLRVIGTCLATGEAAGFAAAMMAESGSCNAAEVWGVAAAITSMNIVEHIFEKADRSAIALICAGEEISYGELISRAEAAAARIAQCRAERVALDCPNGVAHVVLALAIVRTGKCLVPLASELAPPERERVLRETGVGAILRDSGELRAIESSLESAAQLTALNPAFIRFSSGTTGTSKGIVISHETLLERVTAANRGLGIRPTDRVVWILPMAHHFAVSIMLYLQHGATTIIENSHLAEDVLSAGIRHGGTVLYGAPFHHALLAAEESGRAWPTLRLAVSTAAALPLATAEAFLTRYGLPLTQGLGVIEVGLPLLNLHAAREKSGSIGRPLPDYEARLDADGALLLRGPGMFDAYLHPWRLRSEVLEDGWFRTGDLARMDEDGDFFLQGRASAVINVAGLKCFPEEIESILAQCEGVRLVRVSGRPHPKVGAVPLAEIVPIDPAAPPKVSALIGHCRSQLARYKVPVEFRFVESLPLTASGKIKR